MSRRGGIPAVHGREEVNKPCRKARYRSRPDAVAAAQQTCRRSLDLAHWRAYTCTRCRFPDGQRAWHWGHLCRGRAK